MKVYFPIIALLCLLVIGPGIDSDIYADETQPGDKVTIVTPGIEARLCPQPGCGPDRQITVYPKEPF